MQVNSQQLQAANRPTWHWWRWGCQQVEQNGEWRQTRDDKEEEQHRLGDAVQPHAAALVDRQAQAEVVRLARRHQTQVAETSRRLLEPRARRRHTRRHAGSRRAQFAHRTDKIKRCVK